MGECGFFVIFGAVLFDIIMKNRQQDGASVYYRERYGINLGDLSSVLRLSLENLYRKGVRMNPDKLFNKLEQCGVSLRTGTVERTRFTALTNRVKAEPAGLTHSGARFWYASQMQPFNEEEIVFLAQRFPEQTATLYPSLWKGYLLFARKKYLIDCARTELLDPGECVFQHDSERSES